MTRAHRIFKFADANKSEIRKFRVLEIIRRPGYGATDTCETDRGRMYVVFPKKIYGDTFKTEPIKLADLVFFRCEKLSWPVAHGPDGLTATVVYYAFSQ